MVALGKPGAERRRRPYRDQISCSRRRTRVDPIQPDRRTRAGVPQQTRRRRQPGDRDKESAEERRGCNRRTEIVAVHASIARWRSTKTEKSRVRKECVSTCRCLSAPHIYKKKKKTTEKKQ